jgi:hypothetical protein
MLMDCRTKTPYVVVIGCVDVGSCVATPLMSSEPIISSSIVNLVLFFLGILTKILSFMDLVILFVDELTPM